MASTEELLRNAQHALHNISPGSTDEKKYAARAKRLAMRVISRSPDSAEGTQARMILYQLGSDIGISTPHENLSHEVHSPTPRNLQHMNAAHPPRSESQNENAVQKMLAVVAAASATQRDNETTQEDSWASIWQQFSALSYGKKKVVAVVLGVALLFIGFTPFLLFLVVFYFVKPAFVKRQIRNILEALG